ncbi:spore coat protein YutH [Bacillus tianshenii]|nr:spore coat protein YutH [Bacillus tianshenii]
MNEKILLQHYRLQPERKFAENGRSVFQQGNQHFTFSTLHGEDEEVVMEMKMLSDYMYMQGESNLFKIVPTFEQKLFVNEENQPMMLLSLETNSRMKQGVKPSYGRALRERHTKGRSYPYPVQHQTRLGKWKELWASRLEQMEKYWFSRVFEQPLSTFEKKFVESFPYYMGLTENAIQYIGDNEWEDKRGEQYEGTLCTDRFTVNGEGRDAIHPSEWLYDHSSRDISEWIRSLYWEEGYPNCMNAVNAFLTDYEARGGVSLFTWRMVYGRLIFPLHYFQCVESFFTSSSESQKEQLTRRLQHMIENSGQYEQFLGDFYTGIGLSAQRLQLPELGWL